MRIVSFAETSGCGRITLLRERDGRRGIGEHLPFGHEEAEEGFDSGESLMLRADREAFAVLFFHRKQGHLIRRHDVGGDLRERLYLRLLFEPREERTHVLVVADYGFL
jgi:hypothetical protein